MSGRPFSATKSSSCLTSVIELSVPGTTGTPALIASVRAAVLSANLFMTSTVGPMKVMPSRLHACASHVQGEAARGRERREREGHVCYA